MLLQVFVILVLTGTAAAAQPAPATPAARRADAIGTIEDRTAGMKKIDGYFPLYWEESAGRLWMEISRFNTEVLYSTGLGAGLGSNDIGLDRGQLSGSRIVLFERVGPKVLMVQPNYRYRATSDNPAEVRAVRDAFARSVLWGFPVAAGSGSRVLVDLTEYLVRDTHDITPRLRPGTYRFEASRSSIYLPMTLGFPKNTEMEAELTFVRQAAAGGPGGGGVGPPGGSGPGGFFEGVANVAATPEAASLRVHHSFVELPDAGYKPRKFDPRSGYFGISYADYATPVGEPMIKRFIARHRLEKANPGAKVSDAVKPIVYYLDAGTPEPIRSALLDGARWWNQAFEAAGYRNAFRVELLPQDVSPLDVRYNVINWVHRSTRGWSSGATVTDPRTGEIIKGLVTLGSLRVRQDYMIAEGLLSPYKTGTETPPELREWALARMRQLSAHEVGHTLGLGHNYYDSDAGRISVLDYPHPLVTLKADGTLDFSKVYDDKIGDWDKVAIAYGYQVFPEGTDENAALDKILDEAWKRDVRYLTNQDLGAHPRVNQWSNGTDAAAELTRMMDVRRSALARFGETAIRRGQPLAQLEEVLVPLYLHHRYQIEAASHVVGGSHYIYAFRGDGRAAQRPATAAEQTAALKALLTALKPSELALPAPLLKAIAPRPPGYGVTRELFPRYTGSTFDAITPAVVAAEMTLSFLLDAERCARLVEQHALDPSLPGLEQVLDAVDAGAFAVTTNNAYEAEISRAVQRVYVDRLIRLAGTAEMSQVRAIAAQRLRQRARDQGDAHAQLLADDIKRFLERPVQPAQPMDTPQPPPGAPIGEPALDWLRRVEPMCVPDLEFVNR
ncbi:MAG TPA: zinc-dependent metalloprotease [Vicinamibacterales bacterium]|jgi:hypothetical protein|nr:zinc-dependent metalloprotease [Vicinamibacterales bacterium]